MIYPKFLKKNDLIGITALSSGCSLVIGEFKQSISNLKGLGFSTMITPDTYGSDLVSSDCDTRVKEFNELLEENIDAIIIARGGNFLLDTIPYLNYKKIVKKRLLIEGYSDPTSLLYILTTKYDLLTVYGMNAKSYNDITSLYQKNNIDILKGNLVIQNSFSLIKNKSLNGDFSSKGVLIGGCVECLKDLIGTSYDNTISFINKYQKHSIIWYFDIFDMTSINLYLTLLQFKLAGWFDYTDTFIFGEVLIKNEELITYEKAIKMALGNDKKIVIDANIGHVRPSFTILNGSLGTVNFKNNMFTLKQELMDNEDIS